MEILRTIVQVAFIVVCVVQTILILMQEGKSYGLGSLSGANSDSYWSQNKGRSVEGVLVKITRILMVVFFAVALILNIGSFQ